MKPSTPLPWRKSLTGLVCDQTSVPILASELGDAAYIVHACNAYPRLVEALRRCAESSYWFDGDFYAMELLRELGEIK